MALPAALAGPCAQSSTTALSHDPRRTSHDNHLIRIDKDDLLDVKREENVKEQDLVAPDHPLLLALSHQPARPLVLHQLKLKPVLGRHIRYEVLQADSEGAWQ